jgi:hypothetical protein
MSILVIEVIKEMQVHDFEQEHLESVLTEDEPAREAEPTSASVVRIIHPYHPQGGSGSNESNTSKERYDLLPDYAQASFVKQNDDNSQNEQVSLTIQDSKQDVEEDLPTEIKTVRACGMLLLTT